MEPICLLVAVWTLGSLAIQDLARRRLPNRTVFLLLVLYLLQAVLVRGGWPALWQSLLVGAVAFLAFFALFVLSMLGGGDVKLGAVVLLGAGLSLALPTVAIIAWAGGILAVLGWLVDRKAYQRLAWKPARCVGHALSARRGVPYGVALACGGWFVVWQQYQSLGKI